MFENFTYEISIIKKPTPDSTYGRLISSMTLEDAANINRVWMKND